MMSLIDSTSTNSYTTGLNKGVTVTQAVLNFFFDLQLIVLFSYLTTISLDIL